MKLAMQRARRFYLDYELMMAIACVVLFLLYVFLAAH